MKNLLTIMFFASLTTVFFVMFMLGCEKIDQLPQAQDCQTIETSKKTIDYTNPNPTWTQVTDPILLPAKWGGFVPNGYTAGIPAPQNDGKVIVSDSTIVVKWHLHVGLRNFNTLLKPDVIDYRGFYVNGIDQKHIAVPNGGVMGDYDFTDTIRIVRNGYYNSYFPLEANYNWNGITPYIHSSATNGWLDNPFFVGIPY